MGESGRSSEEKDVDISRLSFILLILLLLLLNVNDVAAVESDSMLPLEGPAARGFFLDPPSGPGSWPRVECLLLSEEESLRSSDISVRRRGPVCSTLGTGCSRIASSSSMYLASFLQPCQQCRQSQTRNLKQKASIFMQGWKQMQRFRKSILFLSEWARRRLR